MKACEIASKTLTLLKKPKVWRKGTFHSKADGKHSYCLVGGIGEAFCGSPISGYSAKEPLIVIKTLAKRFRTDDKFMEQLEDEVGNDLSGMGDVDVVIWWNDNAKRKKKEVLEALTTVRDELCGSS